MDKLVTQDTWVGTSKIQQKGLRAGPPALLTVTSKCLLAVFPGAVCTFLSLL